LIQSTEDEGATSERPSEPQPTPSPPHPSEANDEPQSDPSPRPSPTPHIPDSTLEVSGGNQGGHWYCFLYSLVTLRITEQTQKVSKWIN
ncbi:hypothetical protein Tco_0358560, partial [Tanacetum coccineum]